VMPPNQGVRRPQQRPGRERYIAPVMGNAGQCRGGIPEKE
jgi:hypothetical protein